MNQLIPAPKANPVSKPKKVHYPMPNKNEAPKTPGWEGKKIFADTVNGEEMLEELFLGIQMAVADIFLAYMENHEEVGMAKRELNIHPMPKSKSYRLAILKRAGLF